MRWTSNSNSRERTHRPRVATWCSLGLLQGPLLHSCWQALQRPIHSSPDPVRVEQTSETLPKPPFIHDANVDGREGTSTALRLTNRPDDVVCSLIWNHIREREHRSSPRRGRLFITAGRCGGWLLREVLWLACHFRCRAHPFTKLEDLYRSRSSMTAERFDPSASVPSKVRSPASGRP